MLFNSYVFIFGFLPVSLAIFFLLGRLSPSWAAAFLLLASLFFYGWWNPVYLPILLASASCNFLIGNSISHSRTPSSRTLIFAIGIACNLLTLFYFKYYSFFLSFLLSEQQEPLKDLPLGISFFTFTQIAFLTDVYQRRAREPNPIHYGLFVTYFPHLIAGPLLHHKAMMPQFGRKDTYLVNPNNIAIGLTIFVIGLFKKVVLADSLAPTTSGVFAAAETGVPITLLEAWAGALGYTLQLYFDFSGYSEMAIGISRMFNVVLPPNFYSPYQATSISDFWRRWHMTLSAFLRNYLYIPLGGNRHGKTRKYLNLLITMVLGGLWHGAGWTFVIWGAFHGCLLAMDHVWRDLRGHLGLAPSGNSIFRPLISWAATFVCVVVGWVFFRSVTLDGSFRMIGAMAGLNGISVSPGVADLVMPFWRLSASTWVRPDGISPSGLIDLPFLNLVFIGLIIVLALPNTLQIMRWTSPVLEIPQEASGLRLFSHWAWTPNTVNAVVLAVATIVSLLLLSRPSEFLYFQF